MTRTRKIQLLELLCVEQGSCQGSHPTRRFCRRQYQLHLGRLQDQARSECHGTIVAHRAFSKSTYSINENVRLTHPYVVIMMGYDD
jgi:hypothetical protein